MKQFVIISYITIIFVTTPIYASNNSIHDDTYINKYKIITQNNTLKTSVLFAQADNLFENDDIFAPWNDALLKDDIFAPWNDTLLKDDIFAPWNDAVADEEDANDYLRDNDIQDSDYYWK